MNDQRKQQSVTYYHNKSKVWLIFKITMNIIYKYTICPFIFFNYNEKFDFNICFHQCHNLKLIYENH